MVEQRRPRYKIWDKEKNRWFSPIYRAYENKVETLSIGPGGDLFMRTIDETLHESTFPDRFVVIEATGLLDIKNKEIYEGDIGKDRRGNYWKISYGDKKTAAFGAACISDKGSHDELYPQTLSYGWLCQHDLEIIGSVYELEEFIKSGI